MSVVIKIIIHLDRFDKCPTANYVWFLKVSRHFDHAHHSTSWRLIRRIDFQHVVRTLNTLSKVHPTKHDDLQTDESAALFSENCIIDLHLDMPFRTCWENNSTYILGLLRNSGKKGQFDQLPFRDKETSTFVPSKKIQVGSTPTSCEGRLVRRAAEKPSPNMASHSNILSETWRKNRELFLANQKSGFLGIGLKN
jgi:hypothetical protein